MDGNHDSTATVTVIVDSTSSLTAEHIGDLPIEVVPLQLTVGERNYRDGVDLTPEAFYRQIEDDADSGTNSGSLPRFVRCSIPARLCFRQGRALHHDSLEV